MTTGAHEVTTVDELQHPSLLGGGDGGGTLTPRVCVSCEGTTESHEVLLGEGGGTLTSKCPVKIM